MRHLFDQYSQPENRVTHALVTGLARDQRLLRAFIHWVTGKCPGKTTKLKIVEQALPGEPEVSEEDAEVRGLPDAWIYSDNGWALLIESKIAGRVVSAQLDRHIKIARRRGFPDSTLLVLATAKNIEKLPDGVVGKAWNQVYEWLSGQAGKSEWAGQILTYMEVAEAKMVQTAYLKEGTLTRFAGIPFSHDNPFNYLEGKRVLGLLMNELKRKKSIQKLGVDSNLPGRGAIKSFKGWSVWDFMRLKISKGTGSFTKYPHLTIGIHAEEAVALITLPHAVKYSIRKKVFGPGQAMFNELIFSIARNMNKVVKLDPSVQPYAQVLQRHYPSQSSPAVEDAVLHYDLRTVIGDRKRKPQKYQPEWLKTTYTVMTNKKANIQFAIGVEIPYRDSKVIHTPNAMELFEQSFLALKPFVNMVLRA